MLTICKRYLGPTHEAEDCLVESFMIVFKRIDQYDGSGPIEAWLRRIVVNQALQYLRKRNMMFVEAGGEDDVGVELPADGPSPESSMAAADLMALVDQLPDGYRTVFNLYAIEGYSHQEIASQLSISEGTSKSQLNRARQLLQRWVNQSQRIVSH